MTKALLFREILGPVNRRTLARAHHRALINNLSTDTSNTRPSKEGRVIGRVLETNVVKQGAACDVNIGIGIGNLRIL